MSPGPGQAVGDEDNVEMIVAEKRERCPVREMTDRERGRLVIARARRLAARVGAQWDLMPAASALTDDDGDADLAERVLDIAEGLEAAPQ